MKISINRLKQIIKEELESIAEYEKQHEGQKCEVAHPGMDHNSWAASQRSLMEDEYSFTNEDLEEMLSEDDVDFLEEDLFEFEG